MAQRKIRWRLDQAQAIARRNLRYRGLSPKGVARAGGGQSVIQPLDSARVKPGK